MKTTVKIAALIEMVNERNRNSKCAPDLRRGWNHLLTDVLLDAGVYHGFTYLTERDASAGQEPGVRGTAPDFTFPDESRRQYAVHPRLKRKP